ncbi:hypothetical protein E3N88_14444 [Mikania micrantha]|uniref:DDE Tnp4 domain-containing protein n=1 Tax=Mikania micrantha TaxID=192012 RepID=A0A5N6P1G5_9ASTR|nr:hypothetical protein E3N88_14444 [Mikania micrantha]
MVNGVEYKLGYYLGDEIYPSWATIVKSLQHPLDNDLKRRRFKRAQEAARKDVERAFGVLKGKWNILHRPAKQMHPRMGKADVAMEKTRTTPSGLTKNNFNECFSSAIVVWMFLFDKRLFHFYANAFDEIGTKGQPEITARTPLPKP